MRDLNCVRLWNENYVREKEREREVDAIYYTATFTDSLVKKSRERNCLEELVIEKSSGSFST